MSKLYMELDAAVDRVIRLSQQCGNLAEYGKYPEDREWLRNELEQICEIGIGPLPKKTDIRALDDGVYMELFAVKDGVKYMGKTLDMREATIRLTNGLMDGVEKLWED